MRVTCSQSSLLPRLQEAAHLASQNQSDSPLRTVLLTAEGNSIRTLAAAARKTMRHISSRTTAEVKSPGQAAVDAQLLFELADSYHRDAEITLALKDNDKRLNVTCGDSVANILLHTSRPPQPPEISGSQAAMLDPKELRRCLAAALLASTPGSDNPTMNSVRIHLDPQGMSLAGTDGFRMAVARDPEATTEEAVMTAILPSDAARDLGKAAATSEHPILLDLDREKNHAMFTIVTQTNSEIRITTQLTVGHFPDPYHLIPENHATRALLSPAQALATARVSEKFVDAGYPLLIYLHHHESENGELAPAATFSARNADGDRAVHTIPLTALNGPPGRTAVNARFFLDAINPLRQCSAAAIELGQPDGPTVIRNADTNEMTTLSMIMPMYVDWQAVDHPPAVRPPPRPADAQRKTRRRPKKKTATA